MILFVCEGAKTERLFLQAIAYLFPLCCPKERVICYFGSDIYSLYNTLHADPDKDLLALLQEREQGNEDHEIHGLSPDDVAQIYLFFDYDFQTSRGTLEDNNRKVEKMLQFFDNETEHGKLFISYPMVEALLCARTAHDEEFQSLIVAREDCVGNQFKAFANALLPKSKLLLPNGAQRTLSSKQTQTLRTMWSEVQIAHLTKAHYLCSSCDTLPTSPEDVAPFKLWQAQCTKYVQRPLPVVAVVSAFPLFLYDYFGKPLASLSLYIT